MIRPLVRADLEAALALQALGYAEALRDGPEAFASRIDIAPDHCRAVERGGRLLAWLLSHPWRSFDPPTPDQVLTPGGDALTQLRIPLTARSTIRPNRCHPLCA